MLLIYVLFSSFLMFALGLMAGVGLLTTGVGMTVGIYSLWGGVPRLAIHYSHLDRKVRVVELYFLLNTFSCTVSIIGFLVTVK